MSQVSLLSNLSSPAGVYGAPFGVDVLSLIEALEARGSAAIFVARDDKQAATAIKLAQFYRPALDLVRLPGWDVLPYDRVSPSPAVAAARCAALAALAQRAANAEPCLVVTTASSLVQKVPPKETMRASSLSVFTGGRIQQQDLTSFSGLVLFQSLFVRLGLYRRLANCFRQSVTCPTYPQAKIILLLIVHMLPGFRCLRESRYPWCFA